MISKGKYEFELKSIQQNSDERILQIKSKSEKDIDDLKIQILKQKNTIVHYSDVENELRTELAKVYQEKNKRDALIEELLIYCKRLKQVRDDISGGVDTFGKPPMHAKVIWYQNSKISKIPYLLLKKATKKSIYLLILLMPHIAVRCNGNRYKQLS